MEFRLETAAALAPEARELLAAIFDGEPRQEQGAPDAATKITGAEVVAILALIVAVPQGLDALASLRERMDRRKIRNTLRALKDKLEAEGEGAVLYLPSGRQIDLASIATDAAIDLIIKELGGP